MCSLRFENNLLTIEGVRFASISKKTPLSKLSFAFVSLALPLLVGSALACCKACSGSILFSARQHIEVLFAEQSSYENNQETSAVISKCRNASTNLVRHRHFFRQSAASVRHRHSGIRVQSGTASHGLVRHCPAMPMNRFR
jgi:hypothetical protein